MSELAGSTPKSSPQVKRDTSAKRYSYSPLPPEFWQRVAELEAELGITEEAPRQNAESTAP